MLLIFTNKLSERTIKELYDSLFYLSFLDINLVVNKLVVNNRNPKDVFLKTNVEYVEKLDDDSIYSIIKNTIDFFKSIEKMADEHIKPLNKDLTLYYVPNIERKLTTIKDLDKKYDFIKSIYTDKELQLKISQITEYFHKESIHKQNAFNFINIKIADKYKDTKKAETIRLLTNYFTILELVKRSNSLLTLKIEPLIKVNYFEDIEQLYSSIENEYYEAQYTIENLSNSKLDAKSELRLKNISNTIRDNWQLEEISAREVGLFLKLLQDNEIINPSLNPGQIGSIGKILFNKDEKNISKVFYRGFEKNDEELPVTIEGHYQNIYNFLKNIVEMFEEKIE